MRLGLSVTSLHVLYKKEFEPIVRPLENIAVAKSLDEESWKYCKVKYIEPFFINYTTPTIANGSSADIEITELKLPKGTIGHVRLLIQSDGFEVEVKLPEALKKYSTRDVVTRIDKWVSDNYPHLTEIFYEGDVIPKLTVYNRSGADASANIRIVGLKYIVEELKVKPKEYTVVYVSTVVPR